MPLVARQVARRFNDAHFGYPIAAAFMGFIIWTQGLSSSIALANTDESSPINVIHKITGMTVPLSQTIFQPCSWLSAIVVLVVLALAIWRMEPADALAPDPAVFGGRGRRCPEVQGSSHLPNGWRTCGSSTYWCSPPAWPISGSAGSR